MLNRGKEMKKVFMFLLLVLYSGITFSDTDTAIAHVGGNELLSRCESGNTYSEGICHGYIVGVADTSKGKTWEGEPYCKSKAVTGTQLEKIVTKHLNNNPEKLHLAAYTLVQYAFFNAFPCE